MTETMNKKKWEKNGHSPEIGDRLSPGSRGLRKLFIYFKYTALVSFCVVQGTSNKPDAFEPDTSNKPDGDL